jgi:hypothetical protein
VRFRLIRNARRIWHRLWSVRLALLSSICSAVELGMSYYSTGQTPLFVIGAFVISLVGAWSRIVQQDEVADAYAQAP